MASERTALRPPTELGSVPAHPANPGRHVAAVVLGGVCLLAGLSVLSMMVGSGDIPVSQVWQSLTHGGSSTSDLLVVDFRLPRTLLALLVGAGLGAAGAIMQALTRNPLADPGILGVNAGAFVAVAVGAAVLGSTSSTTLVWLAMGGALVATSVVFLVGSTGPDGGSSTKLVLAGVALGAVFTAISFAVTLSSSEVFDRVRYWQAGSLQNRQMDVVGSVLGFIVVGLVIALAIAPALNTLALGEEVASALGTHPGLTRTAGVAALTLLCGAATAAAGPISFLGLMVPHLVRAIVGPDQRLIVPLSMLAAPILLLTADMAARVLTSSELPLGIVMAAMGAPVLIAVTRRGKAVGQ
ncbi:FecCD family ABC transporter permease [Aeromicrobium fastidiosum]|uniref:Iron chelate uptake ABC transporter family permease subunit n=1 Tax=Aeromicrobium fastidiosum TaxID=52699 RepID=A0A641AP60_9ACTN|nr:iron chelate uptake ABC transporter family permease subunit [Aeromicrobium fastidiosum]KAA1379876.1 iron chelate uptake ABC transporter family permease subunit [Aeromicrobium fastidiosum]MBP2389380.1 iron complex transport system permease protein [Aeromicrobium fastidiosum]